jgi:hypothetical protein
VLARTDAREGLHHLGQALAPPLGGLLAMIDADNSEVVRKLSGSHEMVERWHNETLGQIAASAENRQGGGRRRVAGKRRRRGHRGFRRDRRRRTHSATRQRLSSGCGGRGMARLPSRFMLALLTARSD